MLHHSWRGDYSARGPAWRTGDTLSLARRTRAARACCCRLIAMLAAMQTYAGALASARDSQAGADDALTLAEDAACPQSRLVRRRRSRRGRDCTRFRKAMVACGLLGRRRCRRRRARGAGGCVSRGSCQPPLRAWRSARVLAQAAWLHVRSRRAPARADRSGAGQALAICPRSRGSRSPRNRSRSMLRRRARAQPGPRRGRRRGQLIRPEPRAGGAPVRVPRRACGSVPGRASIFTRPVQRSPKRSRSWTKASAYGKQNSFGCGAN